MDQLRQALESREGGKLLLLTLESLEIGEEIRTQLAQAIQTVLNPLVHSGTEMHVLKWHALHRSHTGLALP